MNARRIEIGPLAVLAGSLLLLVSLFLDWYELQPDTGFTAFTVFEFLDLLLAALALLGGAAALGRLLRAEPRARATAPWTRWRPAWRSPRS